MAKLAFGFMRAEIPFGASILRAFVATDKVLVATLTGFEAYAGSSRCCAILPQILW